MTGTNPTGIDRLSRAAVAAGRIQTAQGRERAIVASGKSYRQLQFYDFVIYFALFSFAARVFDLYSTLLTGRNIVGEYGKFVCVFGWGCGWMRG